MVVYQKLSEIVEENGKTIFENNMEQKHNIPLGALVEVTYDNWHGDGACEKVHARLWVVHRGRDCDGTPLYWLSRTKLKDRSKVRILFPKPEEEDEGGGWVISEDMSERMFYRHEGGFQESSLKVIEVTEDLKKGVGALQWEEEND